MMQYIIDPTGRVFLPMRIYVFSWMKPTTSLKGSEIACDVSHYFHSRHCFGVLYWGSAECFGVLNSKASQTSDQRMWCQQKKKMRKLREYTDSCVGINIMFLSSWPSCPTNAKLPLIIRVVLAIILHLTSLFGAYTYIYYLFLQQGEEKETINVIDNSRG